MNRCSSFLSNKRSSALTFAGFDPSGGAGVLADCRVFEAFGFYGMAVVTAFTVQGPRSVESVLGVPDGLILRSAGALAEQAAIAAVKIGMLFDAHTVREVAQSIDLFKTAPVVLDPVIEASDGTRLIDDDGIEAMKEALIGKVDAITPNVPEAERLTGLKIEDEASAFKAAEKLLELGAGCAVIKGGHLNGDPVDFLAASGLRRSYRTQRITGPQVHGTGCAFSSALAALLGQGCDVQAAVPRVKEFVLEIIKQKAGI